MQTDNHPDMLLEIEEQSMVLCETSTTVDPSKLEEQEQLVTPSEASSSLNDLAKLKLGRPQTSAIVVESTKEALADGLKVMSHENTVDKIHTSSQFDALLDEPPSPVEEEPCFLPELPVMTNGVTQGRLRKPGKHRRKGRQQSWPYGLALKNLYKPIFFKRAASRLRRPGKLIFGSDFFLVEITTLPFNQRLKLPIRVYLSPSTIDRISDLPRILQSRVGTFFDSGG
ncbi:hypothetical protein HPP92_027392 [Vanilla planifolia]|uniref:Uncharacterized protein n=1 Tax=Vanilla planifolia TaxID=51239 RepID=A0A835U640_VANPL|nr:hypothetical protein HPP92_027392 [Vanilla planifolia]